RHTRFSRDWSSDVCSSDLPDHEAVKQAVATLRPQEATAIGDGILVALKALPGRTVDLPEGRLGLPGPSAPGAQPPPSPPSTRPEIGRASCRERVWFSQRMS